VQDDPPQLRLRFLDSFIGKIMAQETFTKQQFWAVLEKAGETEVRIALGSGTYGEATDRSALVTEWLRIKDQERSAASAIDTSALARAANDLARSANTIAEDAAASARLSAAAARTNNMIATLALIAAAVAIAISIIGVFVKK
jgi:CHASE3 domain sensor protein